MNSSISRAWNLQWCYQSNTNNIIISVSSTDPSTVDSRPHHGTTILQTNTRRTPVSVKVTDTPSSSQPSFITIRAGDDIKTDSHIHYMWKIDSRNSHHSHLFDLHLYIDGTFKVDAYAGNFFRKAYWGNRQNRRKVQVSAKISPFTFYEVFVDLDRSFRQVYHKFLPSQQFAKKSYRYRKKSCLTILP